MLSLSGDGLRSTTRNIIFLITTAIILSCYYGIYFDLNNGVRNESLYLGLFITSSVMFGIFLIINIIDSVMGRDKKIEEESNNERYYEAKKIGIRFPRGSNELPATIIGRDKIYYNNSFEKIGNIWRTLLFMVFAIFIFISFVITYLKHPTNKKENAGYIIALTIASLAMAVHVGMLIYQLYEFSYLDKSESITNVIKHQKDKYFRQEIKNNNNEFGY